MKDKFRRVVLFHLLHYEDPKKDQKPEHVVMAAEILNSKFADYDLYARECIRKDIPGVTKKTWDDAQ